MDLALAMFQHGQVHEMQTLIWWTGLIIQQVNTNSNPLSAIHKNGNGWCKCLHKKIQRDGRLIDMNCQQLHYQLMISKTINDL